MSHSTTKAARKKLTADGDAQQRRRLYMAELLLKVSQRLAAYDTLDDVLSALVDMTATQLNAARRTLHAVYQRPGHQRAIFTCRAGQHSA